MRFICLQLFYLLVQQVLVNHSTYVKEGVSHSKEYIWAEMGRKDYYKKYQIKKLKMYP